VARKDKKKREFGKNTFFPVKNGTFADYHFQLNFECEYFSWKYKNNLINLRIIELLKNILLNGR